MSLSEQIEELEDRIEELEDENSDLESEVDDLKYENEGFKQDVRELQEEIERLKSQVDSEENKDYTIVENYDDAYHTCLKDSNDQSVLCIDNIDELEDSNDVERGVRLYNTELYEWVNVVNSLPQYQLVLRRK